MGEDNKTYRVEAMKTRNPDQQYIIDKIQKLINSGETTFRLQIATDDNALPFYTDIDRMTLLIIRQALLDLNADHEGEE